MTERTHYKGAFVVFDEDQWKDLKDILDSGIQLIEDEVKAGTEDEAYLEQMTRTWSKLRGQLETYGVAI